MLSQFHTDNSSILSPEDMRQLIGLQSRQLEEKERQLSEVEVTLRNLVRTLHAERELIKTEVYEQLFLYILPLIEAIQTLGLSDDPAFAKHVQTLIRMQPLGLEQTAIKHKLEQLSPMEMRVCKLVQEAMPNKDIAALLGITIETVKTHRRNIRRKLGLRGNKKNLYNELSKK